MMIDDVKQMRLGTEAALAISERTIRRLFAVIVMLVIFWGATIGVFVWYINQFDYESYEYTQDGAGLNFMGGDWTEVSLHGSDAKD